VGRLDNAIDSQYAQAILSEQGLAKSW